MNLRKQFFALLFIANSALLFAGGFQINEHSARAMSMGGAYTAIANDASAVYFNTAAMTDLTGMQVLVGTTLIAPNASFRGPYGPKNVVDQSTSESKLKKNVFFPSHAYFTYKYNDDLALGFGFNNPFGLGTEWEDNWVGRFVSTKADVKTYSLNPVAAYKIFSCLSVGVGVQANIGTVTIVRSSPIPPLPSKSPTITEAKLSLEGDSKLSWGFTAGLLFKPMNDFSLGLQYRSKIKYDFSGTAKFSSNTAIIPNKEAKATLYTPAQFTIGLGYQITRDLLLAADMQFIQWSSYDSLKIDYTDPKESDPPTSPKDYKDTWIGRVGLEYVYNADWAFQVGLLYDRNPVSDEFVDAMMPDSDRLGMSVGTTYKINEKLSASLGYLFLRFKERTVTNSDVPTYAAGSYALEKFNGTYNFTASLLSLSFSYKF